jgi:hypothetical protein
MLLKIEHVCGSLSLDDHKSNHLTLEVEIFFDNSTPATGLSMESSSQKPKVPSHSRHRHHRKEEKQNLHTKNYKAKLE